eukprot:m.84982 g.84982  ORF g.84982 m.84982 type:complete len:50 (+) comp14700_c0_seq22:1960-2109(+)
MRTPMSLCIRSVGVWVRNSPTNTLPPYTRYVLELAVGADCYCRVCVLLL